MGKSRRRRDLDLCEYTQLRLLGRIAPLSYICIPADVEIHASYSKFNKVVCVIRMVVLRDTDFNCFFFLSHCPTVSHARC